MSKVNLDFGNSIVNAYMMAKQQKLERDRLAQQNQLETQKQQDLNSQQDKDLTERKREFDLTHAAMKALNDLQVAKESQGIGETYQSTGALPQNAKKVSDMYDPTGQTLQSSQYSLPSGQTLDLPDRTAAAQENAKLAEIAETPKRATQLALQQAESDRQLKNEQLQGELRHQDRLAQFASDLQRVQQNNTMRLEVAKLSNAKSEDVANILADSRKQVQDLKDEFLKDKALNLSSTQQDKFNMLDDLEKKATDFSNTIKNGGIKYYQGTTLSGGVNTALSGLPGYESQVVTPDGQTLKDVRTKAGALQSAIAEERFKSRFTPAEQTQLNTYVPTANRTEAPDSVASKLPQLIQSIQQQKQNLLRFNPQKTFPSLNPSTTSPTILQYDANGKLIAPVTKVGP